MTGSWFSAGLYGGVDVTAARYLGTIHDFVMLNAITETPAARGAIAQANAKLRTALATTKWEGRPVNACILFNHDRPDK